MAEPEPRTKQALQRNSREPKKREDLPPSTTMMYRSTLDETVRNENPEQVKGKGAAASNAEQERPLGLWRKDAPKAGENEDIIN